MTKSTLGIAAIPNNFFSTIPSGIYVNPQFFTIDSVGRISAITTSSVIGFSPLNSILSNNTSSIILSTSTGSIVISKAVLTTSSYTLSNVRSISLDNYNRVISITTATLGYYTSSPGIFNNPFFLKVDTTGRITSVSTASTSTLLVSQSSVNDTFYFNNSSVTGLLTNYPIAEKFTTATNNAIVLDVNNGTVIQGPASVTTWTFSLINVPLVTGRTLSTTVYIRSPNAATITNSNNSIININGIDSPLYWLDGVGKSVTSTYCIVATFTSIYNGSTFSTYGNINPY